MKKLIPIVIRAYLAGFLDGDGSVYVQAKPNKSYKYGFQVAPYIVLFQSKKDKLNFQKICNLIDLGYLRERKDGILEYVIGKQENIEKFINLVEPYTILKKDQIKLIRKIFLVKENIKNQEDFEKLLGLINLFRELNYSKKRKIRTLTP
jgi:hypothetical protein